MAKGKLSASYQTEKHQVDIGVDILTWTEDSIFFMYSPSLDITGYGNTENEAKQSFKIMLNEFVKYTTNKQTIFDELERLGWTVNRKKKRAKQPLENELLADNDFLKSLLNKQDIKKETRELSLSL